MNVDQFGVMNGIARSAMMSATSLTSNPRQFKGLIIEYIGSQASGLLTIGATSIASAVGALGSEVADTNFTVGATPGTIDLTNAAANTAGELVDFINGLSDYKCRLVNLRRADVISASGYFVAIASQQAKLANIGFSLDVAVSVALHITAEISILDGSMFSGNATATSSIPKSANGANGDFARQSLVELYQLDETLTYTGAAVFEVIEVDVSANTDEVIYSGSIPGATTVAGSKSFGSLGIAGMTARNGRKLLVRCRAATTLSAVTNFVVYGKLKSLV